jgi:diaminohydroxyphosphoribosylaminopyrimidine deaminase/5-amino-6-(5-phosphoribosylamino)uracil reductase
LIPEKTLIVTTSSAAKDWCDKIKNTGAEVWQMEIDLNSLLRRLGQKEIISILVEGGTQTLSSFFRAKLVNKVYSYIAPKIIGDNAAYAPLSGFDFDKITQALNLNMQQIKKLDDDLLAISYPGWES